jgi:Caspase domain
MSKVRFAAFILTLQIFALCATPVAAQDQASRVRILLVLDTFDRMGATWGLDGENMEALFDHCFTAQGLAKGREYTIDRFTGKKVTPKNVLDYYRNLNVGPDEALVFYYSGHGGYHAKLGHFMQLTIGHERLYRNDILTAMESKKPRLKVLLTDCCANLAGGAWNAEPAGSMVRQLDGAADPGQPRAKLKEPPSTLRTRGEIKLPSFLEPPRPPEPKVKTFPKAKIEEPPSKVSDNNRDHPSKRKKATLEEPKATLTKYVLLRTPTGAVPLHDVLHKSDGKIMKQLFFQHKGVVDINGCQKGLLSQGTLQWGGSLFTLAFIHLQADDFMKLDTNNDGFIEWNEIFQPWVSLTQRINRGVIRGAEPQTPEAWQLKATK